jgi:hypothetical protein
MSSLVSLQEKFIIKRLKQMEKDLLDKADKNYRSTNKVIIAKVKEIFKKHDALPDVFKYLVIKQEMERQKVFQQINRRYAVIGKEFSTFLKGSLKENFELAVANSNYTVKTVKQGLKDYEATYQEVADIEDDWRRRTNKHSARVNTIISQGIAKHKTADEIEAELLKETDMQVYEAKRLARTETSNVLNQASLLVFKGMGVKKVRWLDSTEQVKLSSKKGSKTAVCENCRRYAKGGEGGKGIYPINKLPSRIPAHPNCRCTTAPVLDD